MCSNEKVAFGAPLNANGVSQSLHVGKKLASFGDFYYMYTDVKRTKQTAWLIARGKNQVLTDSNTFYKE